MHIKFPPSLKIDEAYTGTDPIKISGENVAVTDITFV
jgi:hypothetical protein